LTSIDSHRMVQLTILKHLVVLVKVLLLLPTKLQVALISKRRNDMVTLTCDYIRL